MSTVDREAEIERIYRARYGAFLRVAVGILRDERLAEEAVHDGFVRALRHHRSFNDRGALERWLWRIVVNEALRHAARGAREFPLSSVPQEPSANGTNAHGGSEHGALEALVTALPERQRLVLFLRYYADLDYDTIGVVLEIKTGTVAATLHAAHTALRRALSEVER
jgi:RNA polymerase sigma-70 factor (ECF subfamily)